MKCDPNGPTVVHVTKLYNTTDAQSFRAFGRVINGTIKQGMPVKVLGENYSPEDEEDVMKAVVEEMWIGESRYAKSLVMNEPFSSPIDMFFLLAKSLQETWCFWEVLMPRLQRPQPL
jgi:translation elongation factor EF-G